jgi:hypothetical protein
VNRPLRNLVAASIAFAGGVALTACGVPIDASPRVLPKIELPSVLAHAPVTDVTTTTRPPRIQGGTPVLIYWTQNNLLLPTPTDVRDSYTAQSLLQTLEIGPGTNEGSLIESDLPVGSSLKFLGQSGEIANVALDSTYFEEGPTQSELEIAQVVFTLTEAKRLGISAVQFWFDGNKIEAPTAVGSLVPEPNQCGYTSLLPTGDTTSEKCTPSSSPTGVRPGNQH